MRKLFSKLGDFLAETIDLHYLKKRENDDFHPAQGRRYRKFISTLKSDILNCEKSLEMQKEEAETIIQENKNYVSSTIVTAISVIGMVTTCLTSILSLKIFGETNAVWVVLILFAFHIVTLKLMHSSLKYKSSQTSYYKTKLKCINELIDEEKSEKPKIIIESPHARAVKK